MPPFLSNSANCKDDLSSYNVSPPNIDAINTPSGLRLVIIFLKQFGKSFTQCKLRFETAKSKEFGSNYK